MAIVLAALLVPLLYLAGLAGASSEDVDVMIDGYAYGSLSMTAYTLGLPGPVEHGDGKPPAPPSRVPGDESNM